MGWWCTGARAWDGLSRSTIHTRHLQSETWQCECGRKLPARMWYVVKMRTSLGVMIVIRVQGHCGLLCCLLLSVWITALIRFYGWTDGRTRPLTPGFLFSYKPTQIQNVGTFSKIHNNSGYLIQNKKLLQAFTTVESGEIYIQRSQTVICQRPQEKP